MVKYWVRVSEARANSQVEFDIFPQILQLTSVHGPITVRYDMHEHTETEDNEETNLHKTKQHSASNQFLVMLCCTLGSFLSHMSTRK